MQPRSYSDADLLRLRAMRYGAEEAARAERQYRSYNAGTLGAMGVQDW